MPRKRAVHQDSMASEYIEDESVRRIAVIDVMNFLHCSACTRTNRTQQLSDKLDALDLAAFLHLFLQREFDVRAIVPRTVWYRADNGYLFEIFDAMGLIIFTDSVYDDLVTIRYAAEHGGFIISKDKYRDVLTMDVTDAEKYVIHNRVIQPSICPFHGIDGEAYTLTDYGDRVVNFNSLLFAVNHNVLFSDPDSKDFDLCVHQRRRCKYTRRQKLRSQLVAIFDFVQKLTKVPAEERQKEIYVFRREVLQKWNNSFGKATHQSVRERIREAKRERGEREGTR